MIIVNTPMGISKGITVREKSSISSKNVPPMLILAQTVIELSGPKIILLI